MDKIPARLFLERGFNTKKSGIEYAKNLGVKFPRVNAKDYKRTRDQSINCFFYRLEYKIIRDSKK